VNLGKQIDSAVIQQGLRELNPEINFDVANRLEEWNYALVMDPKRRAAIEAGRMPVLYREKYTCSLDRDMVPEVKVWEQVTKWVEVPADPNSFSDAINYELVAPADWTYAGLLQRVQAKDPSCQMEAGGFIRRHWQMVPMPTRGRVVMLGWRHTFENLLHHDIPGVTRATLGEKFQVDMFKCLVGPQEEIVAALSEE
jgi:hypothetical protein